MCNLYLMEFKDWVLKWPQVAESLINLPIFRNTADGKKQLVHARWGLPSPRFALEKAAKAKAEKLAAKASHSIWKN